MTLKLIQESLIKQLSTNQSADDFTVYLQANGNLLPRQQLAIYQNNVISTLQKSLALIYPVCLKILGENYFKQIARAYIAQYPSKQNNLNFYGDHFALFTSLQYSQRMELSDFLYLSDLIKLEWFYHYVYYAANSKQFDYSVFSKLTGQQQEYCIFHLAPCLKVISSEHPILSIWELNRKETQEYNWIDAKTENCCIFRINNKVKIFSIDEKTYHLLMLINSGATLKEIVQTDHNNNLTEFIKNGWVDSFRMTNV